MGFYPSEPINIYETIKDLYLFARNLTYRFIFDKDRQSLNLEKELAEKTKHFTMNEFKALRDLMLLYEEGATETVDSVTDPALPTLISQITMTSTSHTLPPNSKADKLKLKSPNLMTCPPIWVFLHESIKSLKRQQWPELPSILNLQQKRVIKTLQRNSDLVIKESDKGANLVLMTHQQYQTMCLQVLHNTTWYTPINHALIQSYIAEYRGLITGAFWQGLSTKTLLNLLTSKNLVLLRFTPYQRPTKTSGPHLGIRLFQALGH